MIAPDDTREPHPALIFAFGALMGAIAIGAVVAAVSFLLIHH